MWHRYAAIATAMKADDPTLKVGGPSLAQAQAHADFDWLARFLSLCRQRNLPLDFCSWHSYDSTPYSPRQRSDEVKRLLHEHGYSQLEVTRLLPIQSFLGRLHQLSPPLRGRDFVPGFENRFRNFLAINVGICLCELADDVINFVRLPRYILPILSASF